jgi:hypothetical protein
VLLYWVSLLLSGEKKAIMPPLPRHFDPLFAKYAGSIPVNFLRALGKMESDFNPNETGGTHWGLLQVGPAVVDSVNKRTGSNYQLRDVLDPELNVKLATGTLRRIIEGYKRFHPNSPNMQEDWANPQFVALVLAGWNSGYSEAGGVGRVAKHLEAKGIPVTHEAVFDNARAAGATKHLSNRGKQSWQRGVVDLFYKEGGPGLLQTPGGVLLTVAFAGAVGYGIYTLMR